MVETFRLLTDNGMCLYHGKAYIDRARAKATQMARTRGENIKMELQTPSRSWLSYGTFRPDGTLKNSFGVYKQSEDCSRLYPKNK